MDDSRPTLTSGPPWTKAMPASRRVELGTGLGYHVLEWPPNVNRRDGDPEHTVVLVHGILDIAWSWQPVVAAGLAGRFHLVAPDMRGHGNSDRVGRGGYYHFMDYVADLHELVDSLGRTRVSLVGHSMGGGVCSYYAGAFPDRVHRLALLEGVGPPTQNIDMPGRLSRWLETWRAVRDRPPRSYPSIEAAAERLRAHDPLLDDELARFLAERGTTPTGDGGVRFKHDPLHVTPGPYPFHLEQAAALWRNVKCPVLMVEGGASKFVAFIGKAELARRRECFRSFERVLLADAGHMMMRHQPAELASILADFLADAS